jgi:Domain of unknown function (DUF4338)
VVFTRLEDGGTRSMDRLERGATRAQSAVDRKSNQSRFLLLPWVRVKGLASKILAQIARHLPADWECRYGYRPLLLETLVDAQRFRGTCYRAAYWIHVGKRKAAGGWTANTEQRAWPSKTSTFIHCVAMCNENFDATLLGDRS